MRDLISSKRHNRLNSKYDYETDYLPTHESAEAKICLECTAKKCNGDCERLKRERKKLKELQNER
jgi:hypothetical protein